MNIDSKEFIGLYDQYASKILTYCFFRVSSKEEAEDITSQTFLKTWDYIQAGNEINNPKTFLYRVATNLIVDYYRSSSKRDHISLDDERFIIDVPDEINIEKETELNLDVREVKEKLSNLPHEQREVIVMRFINDLSISEISGIINISENNVSVRIHRAIEKLKSLLKPKK